MSSSESEVEEGRGLDTGLKSEKKVVGRPKGHRQIPYSDKEIEKAFETIMDICPPSRSNAGFIEKLKKALKEISSEERSVVALKSFVSGRLRESVPECYWRKYTSKNEKPTTRQQLFLNDYMRDTKWLSDTFPTKNSMEGQHSRKDQTVSRKTTSTEPPKGAKKRGMVQTAIVIDKDARNKKLKLSTGKEGQEKKGSHGPTVQEDIAAPEPATAQTSKEMCPQSAQAGPSSSNSEVPFFKPICHSTPRSLGSELHEHRQREVIRAIIREEMEDMQNKVMGDLRWKAQKAWRDEMRARRLAGRVIKYEPGESSLEVVDLTGDDSSDEDPPDMGTRTTDQGEVQETDLRDRKKDHDNVQEMGLGEGHENNEMEEDEGLGVAEEDRETDDIAHGEGNEDQQVIHSEENPDRGRRDHDLFDEDFDEQIAQLYTGALPAEKAISFGASPLRARLTTLTIVEMVERKEEHSSFIAVEEGKNLELCHPALLEPGNWSTECTVDHKATDSERESIPRQDIGEVTTNDGAPLSPMVLQDISEKKVVFHPANLKVRDKVVKVLFRRKKKETMTS